MAVTDTPLPSTKRLSDLSKVTQLLEGVGGTPHLNPGHLAPASVLLSQNMPFPKEGNIFIFFDQIVVYEIEICTCFY